jgi:hypothetical protein
MATPGKVVLMADGKRGLLPNGKVALFDADGNCANCCEEPCQCEFCEAPAPCVLRLTITGLTFCNTNCSPSTSKRIVDQVDWTGVFDLTMPGHGAPNGTCWWLNGSVGHYRVRWWYPYPCTALYNTYDCPFDIYFAFDEDYTILAIGKYGVAGPDVFYYEGPSPAPAGQRIDCWSFGPYVNPIQSCNSSYTAYGGTATLEGIA